MNRIKSFLLAALLIALLTGCAAAPQNTETPEPTVPATQSAEEATASPYVQAPDFTVYDEDGNEVKLSDFLGKPVVLNFWASWCGPCKREMPDFNEKYLELGDEVQFLMINLTDGTNETVEGAAAFIASQGYEFPVFYDTSSVAAYTYGISSIPTTFFIDAEGYAITYAVGAISGEDLQKGIDYIYSKP